MSLDVCRCVVLERAKEFAADRITEALGGDGDGPIAERPA